jgi:hypothetical protein
MSLIIKLIARALRSGGGGGGGGGMPMDKDRYYQEIAWKRDMQNGGRVPSQPTVRERLDKAGGLLEVPTVTPRGRAARPRK